jgi:hypothetical protein
MRLCAYWLKLLVCNYLLLAWCSFDHMLCHANFSWASKFDSLSWSCYNDLLYTCIFIYIDTTSMTCVRVNFMKFLESMNLIYLDFIILAWDGCEKKMYIPNMILSVQFFNFFLIQSRLRNKFSLLVFNVIKEMNWFEYMWFWTYCI